MVNDELNEPATSTLPCESTEMLLPAAVPLPPLDRTQFTLPSAFNLAVNAAPLSVFEMIVPPKNPVPLNDPVR